MMKHIHLVGIGGTGLSAIARLLLESGYTVSGSDRILSSLAVSLREAGAIIYEGHDPNHITGADIVVRSSAIPDDNPEILAALASGIPVRKRNDFLATLMQGKRCLAVAGTHGKTTTTSMLAWVLTELRIDPSFIIGGVLQNLQANAHAGSGVDFVIEADEYDYMFLGLHPTLAIITNIEYDHPDCFLTPAAYYDAFTRFAGQIVPGGALLACTEDSGALQLLHTIQQKGFQGYGYGFTSGDYQAHNLTVNPLGGFTYQATFQDQPLSEVSLQIPGRHNVLNSLAVMAAIHRFGWNLADAARAVATFKGTGRRFQVRGEVAGIAIVDDYAHHPTEIKTTLAAARIYYPGRRIWAVWQPHTYSRTRLLLHQFSQAFKDADRTIVTRIYAAREKSERFSARRVVDAMPHPAHYISTLQDTADYLLKHILPGDVVITLSAGDADQVSAILLTALQQRSTS